MRCQNDHFHKINLLNFGDAFGVYKKMEAKYTPRKKENYISNPNKYKLNFFFKKKATNDRKWKTNTMCTISS